MFCIYCGNKLDNDSVFCPKCGKRQLKEEKAVAGQVSTASGAKKARIITKLSFAVFVLSAIALFIMSLAYRNSLPYFFDEFEDEISDILCVIYLLSSISYFFLKMRGVMLRKNFMSITPLGRNILAFFAAILIAGIVSFILIMICRGVILH